MQPTEFAEEVSRLHADFCSGLADPTRIMIIYTLAEQSFNVNELAVQVGISQPAASRHLKILRDRGLVKSSRAGANVQYSLADTRLIQALDILRSILRDRIAYRASIMDSE